MSGLRSAWEIIATVILVAALTRRQRDRPAGMWFLLVALASAALLIANLWHGQSAFDVLGPCLGLTGLAGTVVYAAALCRRGSSHIATGAMAFGLGLLLHHTYFPSSDLAVNPWKYGVGLALGITVLSAVALFRSWVMSVGAAAVLVVLSLQAGSRSLSAVLVLSILIVCVSAIQRLRSGVARLSAAGLTAAAAGLAVVLLASPLAASQVAETARDRFARQASVNPNPLLAGRIEPPISIAAAFERPVIGLGTTPRVDSEIVHKAMRIAQLLGYRVTPATVAWWTQGGVIYAHSMVFGAWVAGGIFAALPLLAALGMLTRRLLRMATAGLGPPVAAAYMAAQSSWDLVFSPEVFGALSLTGFALGWSYAVAKPKARDEPRRPLGLREFDSDARSRLCTQARRAASPHQITQQKGPETV